MLFTAWACTYDYFEDETNFRLYVPQIENGEIETFYVSFHSLDDDGRHVITRKVSAPFDDNELLKQGILKFKLPQGRYDITTFADHAEGSLTEGEHLSASHKGMSVLDADRHAYAASDTRPRALFLRGTQVFPIGHPSGKEPVEADVDEDCLIKGTIACKFIGLPESVTDIEVTYKGLATRYGFDGYFSRFNDDDTHIHRHVATRTRAPGDVEISNHIFPSTGLHHDPLNPDPTATGEPVELEIAFYNGSSWMGGAFFTAADFEALPPDERPVDGDENPLTELVLNPRQTITFTFKGFTVVGIELTDWGEIVQGGGTIH